MKPNDTRLVVLDDDPTGIQTVHGCFVVTRWTPEVLKVCLNDKVPFFYIITNTRAMTASDAADTIRSVIQAVKTAAALQEASCTFLLRSDSTLRGHFPLELNTVVDELGIQPDARFFIPAFFEAGRYTENDTQWIMTADGPISCGDSEFARDSVFGYSTGHLPTYVADKTGTAMESVITLEPDGDPGVLRELNGDQWCIVNCRNYNELDKFTAALRSALAAGKIFVFQSSSSFPKSFAEIEDKPLLSDTSFQGSGLVIVGSHVAVSTRQLNCLLDSATDAIGVEIPVAELLEDPSRTEALVLDEIERIAKSRQAPVVYTSRKEHRLDGGTARIAAGNIISKTLCSLVRNLPYQPAFVISKGGITSHAILRDGMNVDIARVYGPASAGVPTLLLPDGHRWAGVPYVISPDNVGRDDTLAEIYFRFTSSDR